MDFADSLRRQVTSAKCQHAGRRGDELNEGER